MQDEIRTLPQKLLMGRRALVTGAGRGIGREIARQMALEGADVIINARKEPELLTLREEITAMADASYAKSLIHVERYEEGVLSASRALLNQYDKNIASAEESQRAALREEANTAIAAELKKRASDTLDKVLFELSSGMKNAYARSDA